MNMSGCQSAHLGDGKTYVMYHGTTRACADAILASGFRRSKDGMLGPGVYLSRDLEKASRYPIDHPEEDKVVIKVKVNVGKVIVINRQNHPHHKTWSQQGYDSAWVPPNCGMVKSGLEENCIYDPQRIEILQVIRPTQVPANLCIQTPKFRGGNFTQKLSSGINIVNSHFNGSVNTTTVFIGGKCTQKSSSGINIVNSHINGSVNTTTVFIGGNCTQDSSPGINIVNSRISGSVTNISVSFG